MNSYKGQDKPSRGGEIFSGEARLSDGNLRFATDAAVFLIGFILAGRHLLFSSFPLGVAFVALLQSSVWFALLGACLGSLTLGRAGVIYAMICILVVLLRLVISGGDGKKSGSNTVFHENLLLRMSSAVIGGFVSAAYEILIEGLSLESALFGLSMIILPGALVFLLSGVTEAKIGTRELVFGTRSLFVGQGEKYGGFRMIFFRISISLFLFLISLSLDKYILFGVNLSLIFSAVVTVFAAKRFGSAYGLAVGFFSSVGISGLFSVGFALAGLAAGFVFKYSPIYAVTAGGALLSVWGAYAGGAVGVLSVLPEYLIGSVIIMPLVKYLRPERSSPEGANVTKEATDMLGTMALAFRNSKKDMSLSLEETLISISDLFGSEDFASAARLMKEVRLVSDRERQMNEELTEKIEPIFAEEGFPTGVIRAFGERRPHFIMAGEDKDGMQITSPTLRERISAAAGVKLGESEYFRRGNMVLMECEAARAFSLESAFATAAGDSAETSGDSVRLFDGEDLSSSAIISDGMGSGELAKKTADSVCDFLAATSGAGTSVLANLQLLNRILRSSAEECCATVDMFTLDGISGEASFVKAGAAPSYIKRGNSLFRIKSQTAPLGLIKAPAAEKIGAEVATGDLVIMLSDGICPSGDDAPWLIEYLNRKANASPRELAEGILAEARRNIERRDDMTVVVCLVKTV